MRKTRIPFLNMAVRGIDARRLLARSKLRSRSLAAPVVEPERAHPRVICESFPCICMSFLEYGSLRCSCGSLYSLCSWSANKSQLLTSVGLFIPRVAAFLPVTRGGEGDFGTPILCQPYYTHLQRVSSPYSDTHLPILLPQFLMVVTGALSKNGQEILI